MRTNLKLLRVKENLTQEETAERLGVSRQTYQEIESGKRPGTLNFWRSVRNQFEVPEAKMWPIIFDGFEVRY